MRTRILLNSIAVISATVSLGQAKLIVNINTLSPSDVPATSRLKADGIWIHLGNSASFTYAQIKKIYANIGSGIVVTEDEGSDEEQLFDFVLRPCYQFLAQSGSYLRQQPGSGYLTADANLQQSSGLRYYFSMPPVTSPVTPVITNWPQNGHEFYFSNGITNGQYVWLTSPGGGMNPLMMIPMDMPGYWEIFRMTKMSGSSGTAIKPFDRVSLQSWNGIFTGGNYITVQNGFIAASSPTPVDFEVRSPVQYAIGKALGRVTDAFVYHEKLTTRPDDQVHTLTPEGISESAHRLNHRVLVLGRYYWNDSTDPLKPSHRAQIDAAIAHSQCAGVVFEAESAQVVHDNNVVSGIKAVCSRGKRCYILIPPRPTTANYAGDVKKVIAEVKKNNPYFSNLVFVLSRYGSQTVTFTGSGNSVESALKAARPML